LQLEETRGLLGGKYLIAFSTRWWTGSRTASEAGLLVYAIHKITAVMFDMYRLAGNKQALQVLEGMAAGQTARRVLF